MDYARRRRVKIWGRARVVEKDDALLTRLVPAQGHAKAERSIVFEIEAWDRNCPEHVPQLVAVEDVEAAVLDAAGAHHYTRSGARAGASRRIGRADPARLVGVGRRARRQQIPQQTRREAHRRVGFCR